MRSKYVNINPETIGLALQCAGVGSKPWARLFVWILGLAKSGDRCGKKATAFLTQYLADNYGDSAGLKDVRTAQFTRAQAAREVFGGYDVYVGRAMSALRGFDLIRTVKEGTKGFASLYIIAPFPQQNDVRTVGGNTPTKKGESVGANTPTNEGEYTNKNAAIPQQSETPEQGKQSLFQYIPITSSENGGSFPAFESAEKPPITCPECGRSLEEFNGRLYCFECGTDYTDWSKIG